jgi:hypothetical protein
VPVSGGGSGSAGGRAGGAADGACGSGWVAVAVAVAGWQWRSNEPRMGGNGWVLTEFYQSGSGSGWVAVAVVGLHWQWQQWLGGSGCAAVTSCR